jgi:hypothetical protein
VAYDSLGTARHLVLSTSVQTLTGSVSALDRNDFYRLQMVGSGRLSVSLSGLSADANLELIQDRNQNGIVDAGEVLNQSNNLGAIADSIQAPLNPSTYFIWVTGETSTQYSLEISAVRTTTTDLVWRHLSTGENYIWWMNGTTLESYNNPLLKVSNQNWQLEATGDVNRDGHIDFVWRNYATGENSIWLMNGTTVQAHPLIAPITDLNWRIEAAADFNQDGMMDIVWRNVVTGQNGLWYMNGTTIQSYSFFTSVSDLNWRIVAAADFNQDGIADLVWRNSATGANTLWYMNSSRDLASYISLVAQPDLRWQLETVGDFNQDWQPDLVWRHADTGENLVWLNGNPSTTAALLQVPDYNWRILGVAQRPIVDWFEQNLKDAELIHAARSQFSDQTLDRTEAIALLRAAKDGNVIDATELADLRAIAATTSVISMPEHVRNLFNKVVNSNVANQWFTGGTTRTALGNLLAGSSGEHLEKLISKWFLGSDRPTVNTGYFAYGSANTYVYQRANGQLFQNGIQYQDVVQGALGDCYFLAVLAAAAFRTSNLIQSMFIDNEDDTFTVRFYNNQVADYVTVDRYLPVDLDGNFLFARQPGVSVGQASNASNELWVLLAEKAYAQIGESGWLRGPAEWKTPTERRPYRYQNSYNGIEWGFSNGVLAEVTGRNVVSDYTVETSDETTLIDAFNQGSLIILGSKNDYSPDLVSSHCYVLVGFDAVTRKFSLYNPWGIHSEVRPGIVNLTISEIVTGFIEWYKA